MKRQRTKTLQEVLDQTLRDTGLSQGLEILRIHHAWDQLIGETAARECGRRSFRDGIYTVKVKSSVLRCQLDMQKSLLTGKLNALLNKPLVKEIIIL
ncbi:MAG: DUF721 domain-containing protein [Bacteroidales bacterium]|jgi:predicted nucleic acid-binding Zn ribbon protein|nr:DUF721 domain-containing protein [Bacteroidales bacterium]MDD2264635.1 DUF721 domain-containing protein [Bacteroidales bacterium]MDD2832018.1 DUF721 domain-containing protein [Bacteroidales bacterium]MDD3209021.1 DUF721 domain-containing protein [Bacteroidales bacterium]MDD3697855.1 DUF721 domain-containing protein [Bacteroidales bacterium]